MAVHRLQITAETAAGEAPRRVRGRPFRKGQSGNPKGRPRGSKNRATLAAERLLEGEAAALTRKAVALALAGDPVALRLCLDRIIAPRRERTVRLALPPVRNAGDLGGAMDAIAAAAARGGITPAEAVDFGQLVEIMVRAAETSDFDRRLRMLEEPHGPKK